jgi:hypothetical protein
MTRAHVDVVITMSLETALTLEHTLSKLDGDHPTDDFYQALKGATRRAEQALEVAK